MASLIVTGLYQRLLKRSRLRCDVVINPNEFILKFDFLILTLISLIFPNLPRHQSTFLKISVKQRIGSVSSAKVVTFGDADFFQTKENSTRHFLVDLEGS